MLKRRNTCRTRVHRTRVNTVCKFFVLIISSLLLMLLLHGTNFPFRQRPPSPKATPETRSNAVGLTSKKQKPSSRTPTPKTTLAVTLVATPPMNRSDEAVLIEAIVSTVSPNLIDFSKKDLKKLMLHQFEHGLFKSKPITLPIGYYFVYFFANGELFINPCYEPATGNRSNQLNLEHPKLTTSLTLNECSCPVTNLCKYLEFFLGDDNYYDGCVLHKKYNQKWIPFEVVRRSHIFHPLNKFGDILSDEFIWEAANKSSLIKADSNHGIKKKKSQVQTRDEFSSRIIKMFPINSIDFFVDHVCDTLSGDGIGITHFNCNYFRNLGFASATVHLSSAEDADLLLQRGCLMVRNSFFFVKSVNWFNEFTSIANSPRQNDNKTSQRKLFDNDSPLAKHCKKPPKACEIPSISELFPYRKY
ncbi:hypothetical protein P9112_008988 [Eukaryota sp. TZLM1-RC]